MKKPTNVFILIIIVIVLCTVDLSAEDKVDSDSELHKIAWEMRSAILNMDTDYLMKYLAPYGTYFIDTTYSHDQIEKMIKDGNSWLYKHLFIGDTSVKSYFRHALNINVIIFKRDDNATMISYQSSNFEAVKWIENCLIKINGKWYFDGIFNCQ